MELNWQIQKLGTAGEPVHIGLKQGTVIFIVGANGSGKSALMTQLSKQTGQLSTVRIAAHRQSWFSSSSVDLTPKARKELQTNIASRDTRDDSRWKDDYAAPRAQVALFDLANAQNTVSRTIHELLKSGKDPEAKTMALRPSPLEALNEILSISTLTVRLSINDNGDILAQHGDGPTFSISLLSDGERNALMLAAQVLTAAPDTLFLIDEPERHLHRAITEPMLSALFEKRDDCAFVIATHEPELPSCNPDALVILVRQCSWAGHSANGWDVDILEPGLDVPDDIKRALLGSRRRILFIEGDTQSLDYPLISALFPELSVRPMGSCGEVMRSVSGLVGTDGLHWLEPIGLIDRDDRTEDEIVELEKSRIFALEVSAIESIFYSIEAVNALASQQAILGGLDTDELIGKAIEAGISSLDAEACEILAARRSAKSARNEVLGQLPDWSDIRKSGGEDIELHVQTKYKAELETVSDAVKARDLATITARYAIKKTGLPSAVASALRFTNRHHYEEAIVSLAKRNAGFRTALRTKLGRLTEHLDGNLAS
ncbi:MAG: AAA family ATPase [Pseudomonadota bacterium]